MPFHILIKMGSTKCFEHLPDEILVEIFSYLSFDDLVHSVQYVASRWRDIAHDVHLWRDLVYSPAWDVHDEEIVKIVKQAPKLRTLLIDKRGVRSPVLKAFIENCTELRKLEFNAYQRLSTILLRNLVQNCQNIQQLNLPNTTLNVLERAQVISQLQNLQTLYVSGWGDEMHPLLLKPLADGCPSLLHIDIRNQNYKNEDLEYFLQKKQHQLQSLKVKWSAEEGKCTLPLLPVCKSLKTLLVDYYCDISISAGFESLRSLNMLTSLTLSSLQHANINNVISLFNKRAMSQLIELRFVYYENYEDKLADVIIKNCPHLKVLCFKDCYTMTDASLKNLHSLKELQHLNLKGCCDITDIGMEFIWKCKHLKYLNICSCYHLSEQCMKKMTDLSTLEILKLDFCNVNGLLFSLIPTSLANLSVLSLNYCQGVDKDALKHLRTEMPRLIINDRVDEYAANEGDEGDGGNVEGNGEDGIHNEGYNYFMEHEEPDILYDDAPFLFEQLQRF